MPSPAVQGKQEFIAHQKANIAPEGHAIPLNINPEAKQGDLQKGRMFVIPSEGGEDWVNASGGSLKAPNAKEGSYQPVRNIDTGVPYYRTPNQAGPGTPEAFWAQGGHN